MKTTLKQTDLRSAVVEKQYSYQELIEFLDACWLEELKDHSLSCVKMLDKMCGNPSQRVNAIFVTGTNGKSLTAHFTARLLRQEGLTVGAFYSPHFLTYNERIVCNDETITQKLFTDIGNEVIRRAKEAELHPHALDLLVIMALLYFEKQKVDVAVLEVSNSVESDPVLLCKPKIVAVTRVSVAENSAHVGAESILDRILSAVGPHVHVVSADQNKFNLRIMEKITGERAGVWNMPIRKLASLPYPYEQLHGRSAALAERVSQIYVNSFLEDTVVVSSSLLVKQKGQRGRPKLESKRQLELHPKRTLAQFWKESTSTLIGRFQMLDKEKPMVLLDNARNIDALQNLLLGIRLLHYHRVIKGFVLLLGCDREQWALSELGRQLRYFFKKTSGSVVLCSSKGGYDEQHIAYDVDAIANDLRSMKIKARAAKNLEEAFELARQSVDEREGLIAVVGSHAFVTQYWHYKGKRQ